MKRIRFTVPLMKKIKYMIQLKKKGINKAKEHKTKDIRLIVLHKKHIYFTLD